MEKPKHKNLCPCGHGIYNFGRSFIGLSVLRFAVEKKIFKKYSNFTFFTPKGGGGSCHEFTISCVLTLQMLHIRQSIAIGNLSDSGDLKILFFQK